MLDVDRNLKSSNRSGRGGPSKVDGCNDCGMNKRCKRHSIRDCSTCRATYGTSDTSAWTTIYATSGYDYGSSSSSCYDSGSSSSSDSGSSSCGGGE